MHRRGPKLLGTFTGAFVGLLLVAPGALAGTGLAASFTTIPAAPVAGQTVTFNGSASTAPSGDSITSYLWNFGDGHSQTSATAATTHVFAEQGTFTATTSTPTTTHTYAIKGKYAASLTVVDARGVTSPATTVVIKVKKPTAYKVPAAPKARFTFVPGHPQIGQFVQFNGSKSTGGKHPVTKYEWTFGDGSSTASAFPVVDHRYEHAGKFRVQLIVENSAGALSAPVAKTLSVRKTKVEKPRRIRLSGLGVKVCAHRSRHCSTRGLRVRFKLSAAASVVLTVTRRGRHGVLRRVVVSGARGHDVAFVRFIGRRRGHYVLRAQPAGRRGAARRFVWRR